MSPTKEQMYAALADTVVPFELTKSHAKILLYGPLGSGKTVHAMELAQKFTPPDETILYIDFLEGWVSVKNHPGLGKRSERMEYKGLSQLELLADAIADDYPRFAKVGCIVIDEVSAIAKSDLDIVLFKKLKEDNNLQTDTDVAEWPAFNANTERVRRALVKILKLPVHVIITSHMRTATNKKTGVQQDSPAMSPVLKETISEFLHVVARMETDDKNVGGITKYIRSIQVHPNKSVVAKCRVGGLDLKVTPKVFLERTAEWLKNVDEEMIDEPEVVEIPEVQINPDFVDDDFDAGITVE